MAGERAATFFGVSAPKNEFVAKSRLAVLGLLVDTWDDSLSPPAARSSLTSILRFRSKVDRCHVRPGCHQIGDMLKLRHAQVIALRTLKEFWARHPHAELPLYFYRVGPMRLGRNREPRPNWAFGMRPPPEFFQSAKGDYDVMLAGRRPSPQPRHNSRA